MKKNDNYIDNDSDLEMLDLSNDHIEAADAGAADAGRKEKKRRAENKKGIIPVTILLILLVLSLGFSGFLVYQIEMQKQAYALLQAREEDALAQVGEYQRALAERESAEASKPAEISEPDQQPSGVTGSISVIEDPSSVSEDDPSADDQPATVSADSVLTQTQTPATTSIATASVVPQGVQDLRDIMMAAALKEGGGPMTAVRAVFKDYAFYTVDKDTYEFAPLLDNVPRNTIREDQIVKDDDGTIHYMVDGVDKGIPMIDVSEYQGVIDWNKVAASGIKYAMIRAGYRGYGSGKLVEDKYVDDNIRGAAAAGIKFGVYFFSEAVTEAEAREEARVCINHLNGYTPDLPIVIDVEHINYDEARADALDMKTRTDVTLAFVDEVRQAGYKPMLYTGLLVYFHYLDQSRICDLPLWYAFYSEYLYFPYEFKCWQYTDSGSVPGISGKCDMSIWTTDPMGL